MTTGFYLQDHPNVTTAQYGWERAKLGQPGVHLSGAFGVHTTENLTDFFGPDYNAENVAHFISTRADHGGYHVVADADSIVLLVHPRYAAWADTTNNAHALSVSGSLQAARWLEMTPERRRQVVVNMGKAAAKIALIAVRDGYLAQVPPARRISAQHAINGTAAGFYGHGETNPGTRYDPGLHFDWNLFLSSYAAAVGGGITTHSNSTEEDTLSAAEVKEIKDHINSVLLGGYEWPKGEQHPGGLMVLEEEQRRAAKDRLNLPAAIAAAVWATTVRRADGNVSALQELADAKSKILGLEPVIARIEDNTDPDALADLIPDALAQQVIDALVARLNK